MSDSMMIRQLTMTDHQMALDFLYRDRMNNIYPVSVLESHGFDLRVAEFSGCFESGKLLALLCMKKMDDTIAACFAGQDENALEKLGKVAFDKGLQIFIGKREYVVPATKAIQSHILDERRYDFYEVTPSLSKGKVAHIVKRAETADIPRLVTHYRQSDFGGYKDWSPEVLEKEINRAMKFESGYFYVEENGVIVSCNRIVAETHYAGILDAASTLTAYRGKRIYPSIRATCLEYLFKEGKIGVTYIKEDNQAMRRSQKRTTKAISPKSKWIIVRFNKAKPYIAVRLCRKIKNKIAGLSSELKS